MKTAKEWLKDELNIDLPNGSINGSWFVENHLPMVVRCSCCEMTMALPSAIMDDDGTIYCENCA
jgi:hypothetical protein